MVMVITSHMSTQRSRPRVLVLGGSGMLGHKVVQRLAGAADVTATFRHSDRRLLEAVGISGFEPVEHFDVNDQAAVKRLLRSTKPDYVVNCVGIIKQLEASNDPVQSIQVNALFPHLL